MIAFIETCKFGVYKAYLIGMDVKVLCPQGSEFWYSYWQNDPKESVYNALKSSVLRMKDNYIKQEVIFTQKV